MGIGGECNHVDYQKEELMEIEERAEEKPITLWEAFLCYVIIASYIAVMGFMIVFAVTGGGPVG